MFGMRVVAGVLLGLGAAGALWAQDTGKPAYLDPNLPAEQRAADLVKRMTLEEKASQLVNQARAIPTGDLDQVPHSLRSVSSS